MIEDYNPNTLIETHKGLTDAYLIFHSNIIGKLRYKYDEEVKNNIVKMCRHIVEDFGE